MVERRNQPGVNISFHTAIRTDSTKMKRKEKIQLKLEQQVYQLGFLLNCSFYVVS